MTWFKVDDKLHSHIKARRAGEAMALWVLAGSHCAAHLTDGVVERDVPEILMGKRGLPLAKRLVDAGLWHEHELGWAFHDWASYQPTRDQVLGDRGRKAEAGRRGGQRSGEARASRSSAPPPPLDEAPAEAPASELPKHAASEPAKLRDEPPSRPVPSQIPPTPQGAGDDGAFGETAGAYVDGIATATGRPVATLSPLDRGLVQRTAKTYGGGRTGQALLDWTRASAIAFVAATKGQDPKFHRAWAPAKWAEWHRGGCHVSAPSGIHLASGPTGPGHRPFPRDEVRGGPPPPEIAAELDAWLAGGGGS